MRNAWTLSDVLNGKKNRGHHHQPQESGSKWGFLNFKCGKHPFVDMIGVGIRVHQPRLRLQLVYIPFRHWGHVPTWGHVPAWPEKELVENKWHFEAPWVGLNRNQEENHQLSGAAELDGG